MRKEVTLFRARSISGIPVPESQIVLISFDDRLPVDSESAKKGTVDYNWRDYFGKLEFWDCFLKQRLFGKMHLKVKKYSKIIFSTEMWENNEQVSILEELGMKGGEWQ